MTDEIEVDVGVVAWRYSTSERAEAERARARKQFAGRGFLVLGAKSDTVHEAWVVFVGSPRKLDRAEDEWQPVGGERAEMREDLVEAMARRYMSGSIVIEEDGDHAHL